MFQFDDFSDNLTEGVFDPQLSPEPVMNYRTAATGANFYEF
jgi:hypothetical protein